MMVDQVNNGAAATVAVGTNTPLVDMFFAYTAGATCQAQQVAGSGSFAKALQFTGAASITAITCAHRIEGINAAQFVSQTVTVPVRISNSLLTTVNWAVYSANAVDNWTASTLVSSGSLTVTGTDTDYSFSFNAGANAANGLEIRFSVGAQTSGTWKITGLDMVVGSSTRSFPHLPYQDVLKQCLRYYQKHIVHCGCGSSTTNLVFGIRLGDGMRAAPTISQTGVITIANGTITRTQSTISISVPIINAFGATVNIGNFSSIAANTPYVHYDATNFIIANARLF